MDIKKKERENKQKNQQKKVCIIKKQGIKFRKKPCAHVVTTASLNPSCDTL